MSLLFSVAVEPHDVPAIGGLSYLPNYITPQQESELAEAIDAQPWDTSWQRRRQLYGGAYGNSDAPQGPIPEWGLTLADRIHAERLTERRFDHMLINEYLPGQGIAMHCDYQPFDRTVVSLTLLSACVMDFRRLADGRQQALLLEPRSLLVLSDEARYQWQHRIARRKSDLWQGLRLPRARRVSVTFRSRKAD